ncbi:MAG TPA: glycosyltransferase family 39 protein [Pirellulales bacterium]
MIGENEKLVVEPETGRRASAGLRDGLGRPSSHRGGESFLWLFFCLFGLAAAVRCEHLGDVSYIFDEGFCWKMISFEPGEIWRRMPLANQPPLYFYLLWAWSKVFGHSPSALRAMSVVFGLASVGGAYLLAREFAGGRVRESGADGRPVCNAGRPHPGPLPEGEGDNCPHRDAFTNERGEWAGLTAAALVALSPLQIDWSQHARMYALGAALTAFSSWFLLRATRERVARRRDWALYAATASLLLYTHYYALFIVAAQLLYTLGWAATMVRARLGGAAVAFAAVGASWLPWLPWFLRHRAQVEESFWTRDFGWDQLALACFQTCAVSWRENLTNPAALFCVGALAVVLTAGMLAAHHPALRLVGVAVLTTLWGAAMASSLGRNIVSARYLVFAHLMLLCGVGVVACGLRQRAVRAAVVCGLLASSAWLCWRHAERRAACAERPGIAQAMAYLREVHRAGEPIVVANPMLQIAAAAYATPQEQVRILSRSKSFPFYQGTAVLRDGDFITPAELDGGTSRTLWVVDALYWTVGTYRVDLPDAWADVAEERFPEWANAKSEIVVRRCVRRPSPSTALRRPT